MKYQRFTTSGGKNIGIRKTEFVTKTQFLCAICFFWDNCALCRLFCPGFFRIFLKWPWMNKLYDNEKEKKILIETVVLIKVTRHFEEGHA